MKIKVTLKDPDVLDDSIREVVDMFTVGALTNEELEAVKELRKESYHRIADKWFQSGEYLTVEIDTEAQTCIVLEVEK